MLASVFTENQNTHEEGRIWWPRCEGNPHINASHEMHTDSASPDASVNLFTWEFLW